MPEDIEYTAEPENETAITSARAITEYKTRTLIKFDHHGYEGKKRMFNAINAAGSLDEYLKSLTDPRIIIEGIIVQPQESVDEVEGVVYVEKGVTFITPDGAYFSKSKGIVKSAETLISLFGNEFPEDDVVIEVYEVALDKKRTLKEFRLL